MHGARAVGELDLALLERLELELHTHVLGDAQEHRARICERLYLNGRHRCGKAWRGARRVPDRRTRHRGPCARQHVYGGSAAIDSRILPSGFLSQIASCVSLRRSPWGGACRIEESSRGAALWVLRGEGSRVHDFSGEGASGGWGGRAEEDLRERARV